jgi:cysteine-rich repeat protein
MRTTRIIASAIALALLGTSPAHASFHLMKIVQVFPGTPASPNAQYVVLQMYFGGQSFVGGQAISVFNASGTEINTFTFGGNVANSVSQDKILIATTQAQTFFGVSADLTMLPTLPAAGGKVCFGTPGLPVDCVAWGNYTGSMVGVGTPFNDPVLGGLATGRAAARRLDISGSPVVLEGADDTNDSANDFRSAIQIPANNARQNGVIPPSTCGNMTIEGVEQCDDGDLDNGDGCSSICAIELPPPPEIFANGFE